MLHTAPLKPMSLYGSLNVRLAWPVPDTVPVDDSVALGALMPALPQLVTQNTPLQL